MQRELVMPRVREQVQVQVQLELLAQARPLAPVQLQGQVFGFAPAGVRGPALALGLAPAQVQG